MYPLCHWGGSDLFEDLLDLATWVQRQETRYIVMGGEFDDRTC